MTTTEQPVAPDVIPSAAPVRKSYTSAKNQKANTQMEIEIDGTTFLTRPGRVPGTVQIDFSGLTVTHDPAAMWNYFRCAFVDAKGHAETAEFDRFKAFLDDPSREVDIDMLVEIIRDMIEFANGLPTVQSSS